MSHWWFPEPSWEIITHEGEAATKKKVWRSRHSQLRFVYINNCLGTKGSPVLFICLKTVHCDCNSRSRRSHRRPQQGSSKAQMSALGRKVHPIHIPEDLLERHRALEAWWLDDCLWQTVSPWLKGGDALVGGFSSIGLRLKRLHAFLTNLENLLLLTKISTFCFIKSYFQNYYFTM